MLPLLYLLTAHFVGDFVLQSDWMAQNKSKDSWPLLIHVTIYTATITVAMFFIARMTWAYVDWQLLAWLASLNFLAHFATDWATSRINSRLWAAKRIHWFFVGIGADQLIHVWTLGLTAAVLVPAI